MPAISPALIYPNREKNANVLKAVPSGRQRMAPAPWPGARNLQPLLRGALATKHSGLSAAALQASGLLRFARNDVDRASAHLNLKLVATLSASLRGALATKQSRHSAAALQASGLLRFARND